MIWHRPLLLYHEKQRANIHKALNFLLLQLNQDRVLKVKELIVRRREFLREVVVVPRSPLGQRDL